MSKKNNNNSDKNPEKNSGERKIRQVFPGNEDTLKKEPEKEAKKEEQKKEETAETLRVIRIVSVIVAMICSLLFAMAGGIGLALWDEGRTVSELNAIVFAKELDTPVAEPSESGESAITIADEDETRAEEVEETEPEEEGDEESDYGHTISSDTDGIDSITKAGSGDEIEIPKEDESPEILDPLADYPLPFSTVDESYFTDALFIGDSRLQGFGFWSGIPATYYCATGFHVYKYETTDVV